MTFDGMAAIETRTVDISEDGVRIACDLPVPVETEGMLRVAAIAEALPFVVKRLHPDSWGLQLHLTDNLRPVWDALIRSQIVRAA